MPYAVAALLNYLHETQKHGVERIKTVQNYADAQYMRLSPVTRANLELTETMRGREKRGTLLWVLDKTETSMGKRLLRSWISRWWTPRPSMRGFAPCRRSTPPTWPAPI